MTRTPTPFRTYEADEHSPLRLIVQDSIGAPLVAELVRQNAEENEANAAFIVRACNAHDELVAALHAANVALNFCGKTAQARALSADARRKIAAALAKVAP